MTQKKISLHTSFSKRQKQHRTVNRDKGWGKGLTEKAVFTRKMLYPTFWGAWLAIFTLYISVKLIPYPLLMKLGKSLGKIMARVIKGRRYIVDCNLKLAFPQMTDKERSELAEKIFENSGMAVFETGMAWFWSNKKILKYTIIDDEELERARAIAASDARILVLTCHFVTLELMARMYALTIKPGVGVYRPSDHPVWEYAQVKGRLKSNLALVDRADPRTMIRALMKSLPIWYAPDQDYGRKVSIFVPFFAVEKAATVTGVHDLSKIKNTLVQPSWTIRVKDGYRLYVSAPLDNFPTDDEVADTTRCNKVIENMIKIAPEQYLWLHRRFKTVPDGEPSRYPEIK